MGSIAEMIVRNEPSQESLAQAEQWAMKGLEVAVKTRKDSKELIPICEVSYAVQLFNMASLRAVSPRPMICIVDSDHLDRLVETSTRRRISSHAVQIKPRLSVISLSWRHPTVPSKKLVHVHNLNPHEIKYHRRPRCRDKAVMEIIDGREKDTAVML
jgi:hypothetical protein